MISPDCLFKSIQRLSKISILTPRCAFWLRGVMHTTELDSAVWCTPGSLTPWWDAHHGGMHTTELDSAVWCTQPSLTPRCDAHRRVLWEIGVTWLRGVMHTAELDSAVWCTPRSRTPQCTLYSTPRSQITSKMSVFEFVTSLTRFYPKTS